MVNSSLPELSRVPIANPQYLANGNSTDIKVIQPSDIWITFVHEGAGYRNALGYYTYNTSPAGARILSQLVRESFRVLFKDFQTTNSLIFPPQLVRESFRVLFKDFQAINSLIFLG